MSADPTPTRSFEAVVAQLVRTSELTGQDARTVCATALALAGMQPHPAAYSDTHVRLNFTPFSRRHEVVRVNERGVITRRWPLHPDDVAMLDDYSRLVVTMDRLRAVVDNYEADGGLSYVRGIEHTDWGRAWEEVKDAVLGAWDGIKDAARGESS